MPVFAVTWGDAARFCNWLDNGQGTAANVGQAYALTESGAYNLSGATSDVALMNVGLPAHSGASAVQYFLPSEDEWYKAAYYKSGGAITGYWAYPTKNNAAPINLHSSSGTNNANFYDYNGTGTGGNTDPTNDLTPVGTFAASPGPYGTFDMGGDVYQWNEAIILSTSRGLRGGCWLSDSSFLNSGDRFYDDPSDESYVEGFRVASSAPVPEPGSIALLIAGGVCLLGYAWRRRKRRVYARA